MIPTPTSNELVCVVGGGVIGSSFCAVFLAQGKSVVCSDPFVSKDTMKRRIKDIWPTLKSRGITKEGIPPLGLLLHFEADLEKALKGVAFVQECTFEDVQNKREILGKLDGLVDPSILISSSTSFIQHDILVTGCKQNKDRVIVGHPTIPHIGSFLEIFGTSAEYVKQAKAWYTSCGFDVIVMNKTIPGHVFNSFLTLNMEHGHKLVKQGVCSVEDVNTAMRHLGRDFYGRHTYLGLYTVMGGERGVEGGIQLSDKIKKSAVSIVFYSFMKKLWMPDRVATAFGNLMAKLLTDLVAPPPPDEFIDACKEYESKLTKDGTLGIQEGFFTTFPTFYDSLPYEVGNDPFKV